ncbi:hypothetical protein ELUMI_v1c01050 [Williamsoniiplasma luminosum]|uniref:Uncharacterized protein n=1 Tax=Williamsoniiplasma luminosum TaxID=214888 RepID=A0A2K8NW19_9MOLU|nr:hypothetical protein [Williamsoniiplasma luminosum]ATZ16833.1 hypothetical protein ELUMI_v1c01050 [Williamsoniiplasma luminosum]
MKFTILFTTGLLCATPVTTTMPNIVQKNNLNKNQNEQLTDNPGFWLETYWYWFGYAKLHLGQILTTAIAVEFKHVETFNQATAVINELIPELQHVSFMDITQMMGRTLLLKGGTQYIMDLDSNHKGIWFSTYAFFNIYGPWAQ